jgi:hypothetical protein
MEAAARLWASAEAAREQVGVPWDEVERPLAATEIAYSKAGLIGEAWERAWEEGRQLTIDQAIALTVARLNPQPRAEANSIKPNGAVVR